MLRIGFAFFILISAAGCSSGGPRMHKLSEVENTRAPAAAYSMDDFTFRKDMINRDDSKPWEFYYKHCSTNGNEAFYSKTSYDCTGPFY